MHFFVVDSLTIEGDDRAVKWFAMVSDEPTTIFSDAGSKAYHFNRLKPIHKK